MTPTPEIDTSPPSSRHAVLSVDEMYRADALAIEAGVSGINLMAEAGKSVAEVAMERWPKASFTVLCGPGNNGGDGFVAARYLLAAGHEVMVCFLGDTENLKGDAAHHATLWRDVSGTDPSPLDTVPDNHGTIVIDALFGAGLTRAIDTSLADTLQGIIKNALGILSVDLPSGINGDTGEVLGYAPKADATVTFFRKKPGHLLYPGRANTGELSVANIGTPEDVLETIKPLIAENHPDIWLDHLPTPKATAHKYQRGHLLVLGGESMTGAARLASRAARRTGAGLTTIVTKPPAFEIYAKADPGTMVEIADTLDDFAMTLNDDRRNVVLLGPGAGVGPETRDRCLAALESGKSVVLDADALSSFQDDPSCLFNAIKHPVIMTPHEGEFARLFSFSGDKINRARSAVRESGAVILLKGADTIIASPDGRVSINTNAPADLATAGSGDVLAGIIAGLLSQGMQAFEAASAGAWLHGACGNHIGPGLIAEDLCESLPQIFSEFRS